MSATSGIGVSEELAAQFSSAIDSKSVRFVKVSIVNESLVHDLSIPIEGSLEADLSKLQDPDVVKDDVPAYLLVKLDEPPTDWLAISYVPDSAKVRDKMLYASSRASLLRSLGSSLFTDMIFATSKSDLTSEAYAGHKRHLAAPKPLSAREQEMADVLAAEREASGGSYQGSRARASPLGPRVGSNWTGEVEDAILELGKGDDYSLIIIKIDPETEMLVMDSTSRTVAEDVGSTLPPDRPCFAFFAWPLSSPSRREIIYIYSCPSTSAVKYRMLYSSASVALYESAKVLLKSSASSLAARKIQTSEPAEINEQFLRTEFGFNDTSSGPASSSERAGGTAEAGEEKKPFAKPRGPGRRK